jgi:hypothetical protein
MMDMVLWSGCERPPSGYHAMALVLRLDTWSLPLSVKRGSHIIGTFGEVGWTVGFLCVYLMWGFVKPRPPSADIGGVITFQDAASCEASMEKWP